MGGEYNYDEDGYLWPFFVFTLTLVVTIPLTYVAIKRSRDPAAAFPRVAVDYRHGHSALVDALRTREKRKDRNPWLLLLALGGWAVVAYMVYLIRTTEAPVQQLWNPYDILSLPDSASEKLIKTTFRRLSLKFHPDKIKPDPAKNETMDTLNLRYVEISKAYQALTNEDVRRNYVEYGHPDGKQGFSINIALPKAIISDGNGKYIVLLYALLFGVLLPYTVGSWWYGNLGRSKEGGLMESANRLFLKYDPRLDEGSILAALGSGVEFERMFAGSKADAGLATLEARLDSAASPQTLGRGRDQEPWEGLESGSQRKALALLWAYLGRIGLDDQALEKAKFEVAPVAQTLNKSCTAIAIAFGNTDPLMASYRVGQSLIQAVPPKPSPLLQLPYFTPRVVAAVEGDSPSPHETVQRFMERSDAQRRSLVVGEGLLTEGQYHEAMRAAKQLPYFRVIKAFFKVVGERAITSGSQVTLVVKGRFIPPGTENIPEVAEADLEDVDPAEDDVDAILGRKKATGKDSDGSGSPHVAPLTLAPHFGRDHSPRWHIFLADSKQSRIGVPPFTFAHFDKRAFAPDAATGEQRPTFAVQTLTAQFVAPPGPSEHTFLMHVVCDSYMGFDSKLTVVLKVEDRNQAQQAAVKEDEISEPEEGELRTHTSSPPSPATP